jgi:hypothetical protein
VDRDFRELSLDGTTGELRLEDNGAHMPSGINIPIHAVFGCQDMSGPDERPGGDFFLPRGDVGRDDAPGLAPRAGRI